MSHKTSTPEHQRPTIEELRVLDNYARKHTQLHALIQGLWAESEAHFQIEINGDFDDVVEIFETLKESGNLMGIAMHTLEEGPTDAISRSN